jgi:hypothetical protein
MIPHSPSKHKEPNTADDVSASKQKYGEHIEGSVSDPRALVTPRVRRSTAGLLCGVLGFVGMSGSFTRSF